MIKKILMGIAITALIGAVAVGAYQLLRTDPALAYRGGNGGLEYGVRSATSGNQVAEPGVGNRGANRQGVGSQGEPLSETGKLGLPNPQADVEEWVVVEGTITAVELNAVTIETTEGESLLAQLGPNSFWSAQEMTLEVGDHVQITGFVEDGETFTAGSITNLDTGEMLTLRDEDGRPLWSGGIASGRQGGRNR